MNAIFTYDFVNNAILGSKSSIKKAGIPGSAEYKLLVKMIQGQPTFAVKEKDIRTVSHKNTYKGLTVAMMAAHINTLSDEDKAIYEDEFNAVCGTRKYPLIKKWFLEKFPTFKIKDGKKTAANANLKHVLLTKKSKSSQK